MALTEKFRATTQAKKNCETIATLGAKFRKDGIYKLKPIQDPKTKEMIEYGETDFTNDEGTVYTKKCLFMDCGSLTYDTLTRTRYDKDGNEQHPVGTVYDFIVENFTLGETLISEIFDKLIERMGNKGIICTARNHFILDEKKSFNIFDFDFVESDAEYEERIKKQNK